jgi:hypothetical protein
MHTACDLDLPLQADLSTQTHTHAHTHTHTHTHTPFHYPQRLGLRVGRTWAFNSKLPITPGVYDESQFAGLDFVVYAAGK